ncbi:hypothetical protein EGW69_14025 [Enterococcus faecium]|uniref:hypothetical protein n=1 Tax=Enterococcus faecium TaxID=1352 RepID=UPI000F51142C|nr:hypothetical protein [Enterococcus faecium]MDW3609963.1 hypothetical protein [Enterococcus faecium]ROX61188.1 hypothetical protein EGW10_09050 [Enterococcus faecium]ROX62817.1 hypothetical protein EGW32_09045 [Enterococcus faecium]ROY23526.1 hypothetical protein EGW60_06430 [Enterococcus faecium]ROY57335.1 hypothetical protein EGW64_06430 [Enterococcus faecium]
MSDIVQLKENGVPKYLKTHVDAIDGKDKLVQTTGNQSIDGFKNFLQTPTIGGVNIAKEMFGISLSGGGLDGEKISDGTTLRWGNVHSYDNERSKTNDFFTISSDKKTLTILKDCCLRFDGNFRCQTTTGSFYAYLGMRVNGGGDKRVAGVAGTLNWRNDIGWHDARNFKTGDKVTLVLGTNYKVDSGNAWGVDFVHIQEVIRA